MSGRHRKADLQLPTKERRGTLEPFHMTGGFATHRPSDSRASPLTLITRLAVTRLPARSGNPSKAVASGNQPDAGAKNSLSNISRRSNLNNSLSL